MKKLFLLLILNAAFLMQHSFSFAQNKNIDSLKALLKNDKADTNKVIHLYQLTRELQLISSYKEGLKYGTEGLKLGTDLDFKKGVANLSNNMGNIYYAQAKITLALDSYINALKLNEELKDKKGIATLLGNIGLVYHNQGDYSKALGYYFRAMEIDEELGNKQGITRHLDNIGVVYLNQKNYLKAIDYCIKALKMAEELENKNYIAAILIDIGTIYEEAKDYSKALENYFMVMKIKEELGDKRGSAISFGRIGSLYTKTGKLKEAEYYLRRSRNLSDSLGALEILRQSEELLSHLYNTSGNHKLALIHYKNAIALKDTLFSQENKKQLVRKEMNYEFDKKEAATKAENEKLKAVADAEKRKQHYILILVSGFLLLVCLFAGFIFRSLRITRKQKNIIELQKNEVLQQKEIAENQKEKIVDSITYAKRIQQSILIEESEIQKYLPECFIYFQPKDIVSGDFYWFSPIPSFPKREGEAGAQAAKKRNCSDGNPPPEFIPIKKGGGEGGGFYFSRY